MADRAVVSFGGGVQSTTLAMLIIEQHPELMRAMGDELPTAFMFADTGDEPEAVYAHVERMEQRIKAAGFDFVTVSAGCLSEHVLERASAGQRGISMPPMFVKTRDRCLRYLSEVGAEAPRSACVFCPFHSTAEWRRILSNEAERKRVIAFERAMHAAWDEHGTIAGLESRPYLHRSRVPIDQVDFDQGQQSLWSSWDQECAGVCGV